MAQLDYKKLGESIVKYVGQENISSITHCSTRLRIIVKDRSKINDKEVESIDGVNGVFFNAGQYQIILGSGVVTKVYEELMHPSEQNTPRFGSVELETIKQSGNPIKQATRVLADIFIDIIPGIIATGLFLGLKGVMLNENVLAFFGLTPSSIPPHVILLVSILTDTVFASLPALICWSAFKKFGGMPILGFIIGLMLVSPSLPNAYSVADANSSVEAIMLFGFLPIVGYQGSVLTALVVGMLGAKFERALRRKMPNALDLMFTPFFVISIMFFVGMFILGPLLHLVEAGLIIVVNNLITIPFGIGGFIIGFIYPLSVMTGMHHLFLMIETTLLGATGFNPLITLCAMYGFANASISFAISLKAKNKKVKVIGLGAGLTQLMGVSEPALFGITLRYGSKLLMILLGCSALGGAILSFLGVQANSYGLAVVLSPLMYIYDPYQLAMYLSVGLFTFVLGFVTTYLFAVPKELLVEE